jgi:hypothetical protein
MRIIGPLFYSTKEGGLKLERDGKTTSFGGNKTRSGCLLISSSSCSCIVNVALFSHYIMFVLLYTRICIV